jgi:hypothetical protein
MHMPAELHVSHMMHMHMPFTWSHTMSRTVCQSCCCASRWVHATTVRSEQKDMTTIEQMLRVWCANNSN